MEAAALVPAGYRLLLADRPDLLDQVWGLRVLAWQTQADVTVQAGGGWRDVHDDDAHHWVICTDDSAAADQVVAAIRMTLHLEIEGLPDADVYRGVLPSDFPVPVASYNRMVVDPTHRRRGLSTVLDAVCIEHARLVGARALVGATGSVEANRHRITTMEGLGFVRLGLGSASNALPFEAGRPTVMALVFERDGD
jgi:GNAT superfamily N-acetyltransferase